MNTPVEQFEPSMSLGERFRQTRTVLNLSVEDVVARTNLNASIINKLENDEFDGKSIPETFVNGYIRSYAQFLKMPEEQWKNVALGQKIENDLNKNARTGQVTNPYSSLGRWVWYLTILVVLSAGTMTALWWWEKYQQSNNERDNLVQNYVTTESPTPQANLLPENNVSQPNTVEVQPIQTTTDLAAPENSQRVTSKDEQPATLAVTPPAADTPVTVANNDTPLSVNVMPIENTAQAVLKQHTAEQQSVNEIQNPEDAVLNPAQATAVNGDLQIEVTGQNCWITVRDAKRKVLAQKEYKQGEILTFNDGAPYSLTIGAPGNVKITYKGEAYPLKVDGRVARFKLD